MSPLRRSTLLRFVLHRGVLALTSALAVSPFAPVVAKQEEEPARQEPASEGIGPAPGEQQQYVPPYSTFERVGAWALLGPKTGQVQASYR